MYLFRRKRWVNLFFMAICLVVVVGSQNRSIIVSYIMAFLLVGFFIMQAKNKLKINYIKTTVFILTLLIISFVFLAQLKQWDYYKDRYSRFTKELSGEVYLSIYDVRKGRAIATLKRWLESPFIGLGWGSQGTEYDIYKSGQYITTYYGTPHNYFATILENTGLIGFIIMLYFFYSVFKYARPREKLRNDNVFTFTLFCFFLICHVFNFVNVYMSHGSAAYISLSFFIWGLTVANYKVSKAKKE
jgi:O-antigen ligase